AILRTGCVEEKKMKNAGGTPRWIVLAALATAVLFLLVAIIFLTFGTFFVEALKITGYCAIFVSFTVVGCFCVLLTFATLVINNSLLALSVFVAALIHILLAVPLIVFFALNDSLRKETSLPLLIVFPIELFVAALLAVVAIVAFLEMRKKRTSTPVLISKQVDPPAVAFVTTVNRSPPTSSRRFRALYSFETSSARYLSSPP
ncbi:hypothetical protein PFISCL1PPCAC_27814, partial [Pristionchus fissidentatus]